MAVRHVTAYIVVQVAGGLAGALLANVMFDRRVFELATTERITTGHLIGETVATAGRVFSDTFAGIAPSSAPGFIAAQIVGALIGLALVVALYPVVAKSAASQRSSS